MAASLQHTLGYLEYLLGSKNKHSVHSPFLFQFVDQVINGSAAHPEFERIEKLRSEMLNSSATVAINDLGTSLIEKYDKKLSVIVGNAAKRAKYAKLLYRIIQFYQPQICIELGTNVGISTMYQALALNDESYLHTIEGSNSLAEIAQFNLEKLALNEKVQVHIANFDERLPEILSHTQRVDYLFIDGNHLEEATMKYFEQALKYSHNHTILVFDDINWSTGMQSAWMQIKEHPKVTATIDLYFLGIVFLKEELSKEHFTIRF
jgi:predicted O-methyltransferase YrrM